MIKAARAKKYRQDEGFVDDVTVQAVKLPVEVSETLGSLARHLACVALVPLAIAESVIVESALTDYLNDLRIRRNN